MRVQFLGTGTPLGQEGRLQACILVQTADEKRVLLDCGMTSLVALARAHVELDSLDAIVISHLHGDHFGGLPLVLLDIALRQHTVRRSPLYIAGPAGTAERVRQALELFGWEGAWSAAQLSGTVEFVTLDDRQPAIVAGFELTAFNVPHAPSTNPTALRVSCGGKTVAYSGDSGWSDALLDLAAGADLFICGVWSFDTPDPTFLDYTTLLQHRDALTCKRLILTHLGPSVLEHRLQLARDHPELAEEGLVVDI